jgi:hypothetical protein
MSDPCAWEEVVHEFQPNISLIAYRMPSLSEEELIKAIRKTRLIKSSTPIEFFPQLLSHKIKSKAKTISHRESPPQIRQGMSDYHPLT